MYVTTSLNRFLVCILFIQGLEAYNTRVFKMVGEGGKVKYELRFASSAVTGEKMCTPMITSVHSCRYTLVL